MKMVVAMNHYYCLNRQLGVICESECEVVLSKEDIVVLAQSSLGELTPTTLSAIIVVSALSAADGEFSKSKALLKIFSIDGFSIICCRSGLTGLEELFLLPPRVLKKRGRSRRLAPSENRYTRAYHQIMINNYNNKNK